MDIDHVLIMSWIEKGFFAILGAFIAYIVHSMVSKSAYKRAREDAIKKEEVSIINDNLKFVVKLRDFIVTAHDQLVQYSNHINKTSPFAQKIQEELFIKVDREFPQMYKVESELCNFNLKRFKNAKMHKKFNVIIRKSEQLSSCMREEVQKVENVNTFHDLMEQFKKDIEGYTSFCIDEIKF